MTDSDELMMIKIMVSDLIIRGYEHKKRMKSPENLEPPNYAVGRFKMFLRFHRLVYAPLTLKLFLFVNSMEDSNKYC